MANIKQPKWHAATSPVPHQRRPTVLADHDLAMNTNMPTYFRDAVIEAFEVKDDNGNFVGLVWCVPNKLAQPGATRYTRAWYAIATDCVIRGCGKFWYTKSAAIDGLIKITKKKRGRPTKSFLDDMAALAAANL